MDIDVARHAIRQSFRIGRELQDTLFFLKEHCEPYEYKRYAVDIATALDAVNTALLKSALRSHPALENEIESQIATRGRYL